MTETQLVESNQSMSMLRRGLLENHSTMRRDLLGSHSIMIQIQITNMETVMMKMMTDTTTKREATIIEEAQTTEEVLVMEVVNHNRKTTRFVKQSTMEMVIAITKGMTTIPATITRTTFILTDTNASRNTALTMSKLATLKTTLSTKEDIPELKMT